MVRSEQDADASLGDQMGGAGAAEGVDADAIVISSKFTWTRTRLMLQDCWIFYMYWPRQYFSLYFAPTLDLYILSSLFFCEIIIRMPSAKLVNGMEETVQRAVLE
ncbi:unnamed protein product [Gongylonema pulchrum]|uniref:PhoLip_ATPase_N domain-containing protein n=1 Tax=Gongylonema pulchrum TaxID=637853 RepID=A0A183EMB1_9BILA|nr:unnamed protein product [Gongylonema pulchrum]